MILAEVIDFWVRRQPLLRSSSIASHKQNGLGSGVCESVYAGDTNCIFDEHCLLDHCTSTASHGRCITPLGQAVEHGMLSAWKIAHRLLSPTAQYTH
jgi:hypothetical protein